MKVVAMHLPMLIAAAISLVGCGPTQTPGNAAAPAAPQATVPEVTAVILKSADGVTVHARHYAARQPKGLILLFHQAGSGKGEYATIAPRLVAAGYDALAIDQRSGGAMFGANATVIGLGREAAFLDALPDMQAALDWAGARKLPVVLWGSSYSSSLVFALAAANSGKVRGVMAFSPGEYFDDKALVRTAAAGVAVPVYVTSASDAGEVAAARAVFDAVTPSSASSRYVPVAGIHGSSTLIDAKNPQGSAVNWASALGFLARIVP